jgi:plasmid stability protein
MASMTLKDIPEDLHAQLKQVASANFRSVDQEALARLQRSFDLEAAQNTERDQRWVDEALASGPETPLTRAEMDAVRETATHGELKHPTYGKRRSDFPERLFRRGSDSKLIEQVPYSSIQLQNRRAMPSTTSACRAFGTLKLTDNCFGLRADWDTCTLFFASVRTLATPRICRQCFLSAGTVRAIVTNTFILKGAKARRSRPTDSAPLTTGME